MNSTISKENEMIYLQCPEDIDNDNIKEVIAEKCDTEVMPYEDSYWRLFNAKYENESCNASICNADTFEEIAMWADLHGVKIVKKINTII